MSYFKERTPDDYVAEMAARRAEREANNPISPEEQEARAAKQEAQNANLAKAARNLISEPAVTEEEKALKSVRDYTEQNNRPQEPEEDVGYTEPQEY